MNYLIIDDEPIAHRIIEGYCADLTYLTKIGNAHNVFEATEVISRQRVDLIFLDINMPKMTGFEWLPTLSQPPKIIVTTAYQEFALEGYELDVVDYLLKPFSFTRFLRAVNKAVGPQPSMNNSSAPAPVPTERSLFLKGDKKHHFVKEQDLLFIEAYGNYSKVYLREEMILTHESISSLEAKLDAACFMRVHKSFLLARDKIKTIEGNLIHLEQHTIPVGQTYRSKVTSWLKG